MKKLNPLDSVPRLYRLQIFLPNFPDYPLYSAPMTAAAIKQERVRLLDAGYTAVVQEILPDVSVIRRIPVEDFI